MPNPVTHSLLPMLIAETYRRYVSKKPFKIYWIYLLGFFAAAPDLDLVYSYLWFGDFYESIHRTWTHSLLLIAFIAIIAFAIWSYSEAGKKNDLKKGMHVASIVLFVAALGLSAHTLLDMFNGFDQPLYPLYVKFGFGDVSFSPETWVMMDGVFFFAWLLYDKEVLALLKSLTKSISRRLGKIFK